MKNSIILTLLISTNFLLQANNDPILEFSGKTVFTDASGPNLCGVYSSAFAYISLVESGCSQFSSELAM